MGRLLEPGWLSPLVPARCLTRSLWPSVGSPCPPLAGCTQSTQGHQGLSRPLCPGPFRDPSAVLAGLDSRSRCPWTSAAGPPTKSVQPLLRLGGAGDPPTGSSASHGHGSEHALSPEERGRRPALGLAPAAGPVCQGLQPPTGQGDGSVGRAPAPHTAGLNQSPAPLEVQEPPPEWSLCTARNEPQEGKFSTHRLGRWPGVVGPEFRFRPMVPAVPVLSSQAEGVGVSLGLLMRPPPQPGS